ncbi:unnamed protein product [Protopolystoma xenopodis]|uniref:Uncharacterized protein n=1 Tax=Protopolystoma xenopodis TaxID=117903 RepID=A0A448XCB4_9PLAT|nr:unnamed protein product [Protopolystoma xenopodis]
MDTDACMSSPVLAVDFFINTKPSGLSDFRAAGRFNDVGISEAAMVAESRPMHLRSSLSTIQSLKIQFCPSASCLLRPPHPPRLPGLGLFPMPSRKLLIWVSSVLQSQFGQVQIFN